MFFLLTIYILEIIFGATYWLLGKTTSGIYYFIYGHKKEINNKLSKDTKVLVSKDDTNSSNKLFEIFKKIKTQDKTIKILNQKIDKLLMNDRDGFIEISIKSD